MAHNREPLQHSRLHVVCDPPPAIIGIGSALMTGAEGRQRQVSRLQQDSHQHDRCLLEGRSMKSSYFQVLKEFGQLVVGSIPFKSQGGGVSTTNASTA